MQMVMFQKKTSNTGANMILKIFMCITTYSLKSFQKRQGYLPDRTKTQKTQQEICEKGIQLYLSCAVKEVSPTEYFCRSQSSVEKTYMVLYHKKEVRCSCYAWSYSGQSCKHMAAAWLYRKQGPPPQAPIADTVDEQQDQQAEEEEEEYVEEPFIEEDDYDSADHHLHDVGASDLPDLDEPDFTQPTLQPPTPNRHHRLPALVVSGLQLPSVHRCQLRAAPPVASESGLISDLSAR